MKTFSIQEKLDKLGKLKPTDVNAWSWDFITQVRMTAHASKLAGQVTRFSEKQIEKIDQLFDRHFPTQED